MTDSERLANIKKRWEAEARVMRGDVTWLIERAQILDDNGPALRILDMAQRKGMRF